MIDHLDYELAAGKPEKTRERNKSKRQANQGTMVQRKGLGELHHSNPEGGDDF